MFQIAKLKEPKFHVVIFDSFKPIEFIETIKTFPSFYDISFHIKIERNTTLEIIDGNKKLLGTLKHNDFFVGDEKGNWEKLDSREFNKKYSIIEEK